jgi:hypothetical protein
MEIKAIAQSQRHAVLQIPANELLKFKELCYSETLSSTWHQEQYEKMAAGLTTRIHDDEELTFHIFLDPPQFWAGIVNWAMLKYPHWFR